MIFKKQIDKDEEFERNQMKLLIEDLKILNNEYQKLNEMIKEELTEEKKAYIKMYNMYVEEKERNDKAIEYITGEMSHHTSNGRLTRQTLINILKGSDKE